ncbi:DUF1573 domain-containing protein [Polaribacter sp. IC073]|uniref:DUF1573 domain-containing protein n=1 Tax=Polaribacter sp. IC073 TaxID=2508540 RepID=UPI0011BF58FF|nr:DUF1573 domain-containing protein [Polaribacter sp. IC073]TXD48260.1 DUF1573 domain-containing protein [Polaribacter sp. IC073]
MKAFGIFLGLLFITFSMNSQEFKFEKETIDYGKINKGTNGERTFVFINIGDAPLLIKNIQSSCGCTVPEKPEKPIMPGEKGKIKVAYNTNIIGGFSKQITILSNAKSARKILKIRGYITKEKLFEKEKSMLLNN